MAGTYVHDPLQGILVCRPDRLFFLSRIGSAQNTSLRRTSDMDGIIRGTKSTHVNEPTNAHTPMQMCSVTLRRSLKDFKDDLTLDEFEDMELHGQKTEISMLDTIRCTLLGSRPTASTLSDADQTALDAVIKP